MQKIYTLNIGKNLSCDSPTVCSIGQLLSFCCILLGLSRGLQCYLWYVADSNLGVGLGQKCCWLQIWTCLLGVTLLSAKVGLSVSLPFMPIWLWWLMHVELCCTLKYLESLKSEGSFDSVHEANHKVAKKSCRLGGPKWLTLLGSWDLWNA